jgi:hypothetical protein
MQNKNLIVLLIIIVMVAAVYLMFAGQNAQAPTVDESEAVAESIDFVGMTVPVAEATAVAAGEQFRIVEINGEMQTTTSDFQAGRINAVVNNDIVTSYTIESANPASHSNPYFSDNALTGEMIDVQSPPNETDPNTHDGIIGMTTAQAEAYAAASDVDFRVGMIDGEGMPVTMDYLIGRITAEVASGVVVGYTVER